jgi:hypothetical protein
MRWGLFLGCKVRAYNAVGKIVSVNTGDSLEVHFMGDSVSSMANIKDCKPILRPLSSMTEEEKREFPDKKRKLTQARFDGEYAFLIFTKGARVARVSDILWLMERGFYVNQCREDQCIIETKE